jgi:hypothetical protein
MQDAGLAGVHRRTHRREGLPAGGPRKRNRSRECREVRCAHLYGSGLASEARGKEHPQPIEGEPLPENSRTNGGQCSPHSKNPFARDPSLAGIHNFFLPVHSDGVGMSHGTDAPVS